MELPKHFYGTVELNHHVLRKDSESVFVVLLVSECPLYLTVSFEELFLSKSWKLERGNCEARAALAALSHSAS